MKVKSNNLLAIFVIILLGTIIGFVDYSARCLIKPSSFDTRSVIINNLIDQFDPFKNKGITIDDIESVYSLPIEKKRELEICRFQIVNKVVYGQSHLSIPHGSASNIYRVLGVALQRIVKTHDVGNVDFIISAVDSIDTAPGIEDIISNAPIFMMSKNLSSALEQKKLLMPDAYILTRKTWPALIKEINQGSQQYPWHKKDSSKIFWRGATSGGIYNLEQYEKMPRLTLVMLSRLFPSLVDAQFTHYTDAFSKDDSGLDLLKALITILPNDGHVVEFEHLRYKYLISVDGNTCAWARVPWIMLSNSVLLKQETELTQFFYPAMQPYIHYVPLKKDLSDLFEKLAWLKDNDAQAMKISNNATNFIKQNLMPEDLDDYLAIILAQYNKLQTFEVNKHTLPLFTEIEY